MKTFKKKDLKEFFLETSTLRRLLAQVIDVYSAKVPSDAIQEMELTSPSANAGVLPSVRATLGLDFPGRIHGEHAFFGKPGKHHSDCRHVLFDSGRRGLAPKCLDVGDTRGPDSLFFGSLTELRLRFSLRWEQIVWL